jgi:hypothetical protein
MDGFLVVAGNEVPGHRRFTAATSADLYKSATRFSVEVRAVRIEMPMRAPVDDRTFAIICAGGALDRIRSDLVTPKAPVPLQVIGHVIDPEAGDLTLRVRHGWADETSLRPSGQEELDAGTRIWVRLNDTEVPYLEDDASSVMEYGEFRELSADASRELVNEAIQALMQIWLAATNRVNTEKLSGGSVRRSLRKLNRIAAEDSPIVAWEDLIRNLLMAGRTARNCFRPQVRNGRRTPSARTPPQGTRPPAFPAP